MLWSMRARLLLPTLAVAGAALAQEPPPAAQVPPVRAEIVQLDVVVTGKDGRPVPGLAAADFEVLEDGKRQGLSHFAEERRFAAREAEAAPAAAPPGAGPPPPPPRFSVSVLNMP
jgi:hypothetical protein